MDTFSACVAFGPLAIYLLLLGAINSRQRPLVVTGTRETLGLALALVGLVIVGPLQLFMPASAATHFGPLVWALLIGLYCLAVALFVLIRPPRLVVYNSDPQTVLNCLMATATRLDGAAVWAGRALSMPNFGVHLRVEGFPPLHNVSLLPTSYDQNPRSWRTLAKELRLGLEHSPVPGRSHGVALVLAALLMLMTLALRVAADPQTVAHGLARMLNP